MCACADVHLRASVCVFPIFYLMIYCFRYVYVFQFIGYSLNPYPSYVGAYADSQTYRRTKTLLFIFLWLTKDNLPETGKPAAKYTFSPGQTNAPAHFRVQENTQNTKRNDILPRYSDVFVSVTVSNFCFVLWNNKTKENYNYTEYEGVVLYSIYEWNHTRPCAHS